MATGGRKTASSDISARLDQFSTKSSDEKSFFKTGSETKPQSPSENKQFDSSTQPSDGVATSSSMTTPSTDSPISQHSNVNVLGYKVMDFKGINVKVSGDELDCRITGCCFIPGGALLLSDCKNHKLKLLDRSLTVVDSLDVPAEPHDVAAVDNSEGIVSIPDKKKFQFIQVLPSLKLGRTIDVGVECYGLATAAGKIFVSCYNYDDKVADIRIYDLEGRDMGKRIDLNQDGSRMFHMPNYVAVSRSGDKLFVSDQTTHTVSCLTNDGTIVYRYKNEELIWPRGLLVDDNDNVIVCAEYSLTVQVITSAGTKHKTLLSSRDIPTPYCVSFKPSNGALVVGGYDDIIMIFRFHESH